MTREYARKTPELIVKIYKTGNGVLIFPMKYATIKQVSNTHTERFMEE